MSHPMEAIGKIQADMMEVSGKSERAAKRYEAHMMLYNAAVQTLDNAEMQTHRDTLHTLLDVILDCSIELHHHNKALADQIVKLGLPGYPG